MGQDGENLGIARDGCMRSGYLEAITRLIGLDAALPRDDAIVAAENERPGHGQRLSGLSCKFRQTRRPPEWQQWAERDDRTAQELSKRAAHRDDLADLVGMAVTQMPREHPTKAEADNIHRTMLGVEREQAPLNPVQYPWGRAEICPKLP